MSKIFFQFSFHVLPPAWTVWKLSAFYGWFQIADTRIESLGITAVYIIHRFRKPKFFQLVCCNFSSTSSIQKIFGIFWQAIRYDWVLSSEVNSCEYLIPSMDLPLIFCRWGCLVGFLISCFGSKIYVKTLVKGFPFLSPKSGGFGGKLLLNETCCQCDFQKSLPGSRLYMSFELLAVQIGCSFWAVSE
jgi:hypothetical protein